MATYMENQPYLRYFLKIDAKMKYNKGEDIYISKKSDISRMECRYIVSNDVKKYALKYNKKTNPIDFDKLDDMKYDFYKAELKGIEL